MIYEAVPSPYLVPFDGTFRIGEAPTAPPSNASEKKALKESLARSVSRLDRLQRKLYADDHWSVLLVFQAMDAAGKDSTIRAVLRGVNPQGCQVSSFKQPSRTELDHDFLWRIYRELPERGRIGVFNRSHYEEVLVVRVHPEYLEGQRLPGLRRREGHRWRSTPDRTMALEPLWKERFESIVAFERHLARNGYVLLKFFLHVSREEQAARFRRRIDRPDKNWKFSEGDLAERERWNEYMKAYEAALNATSRPWAPWYAVPADDKPFLRATVADLLVRSLKTLGLAYPELGEERRHELEELRSRIV